MGWWGGAPVGALIQCPYRPGWGYSPPDLEIIERRGLCLKSHKYSHAHEKEVIRCNELVGIVIALLSD